MAFLIEVLMSKVLATDGIWLEVDSMAETMSYNADGTVAYVEVVASETYRQTWTWSNGLLMSVSRWVKQ